MSNIIKNITIFTLLFAFFFLLIGTTHFADPDSFYNTKMALLMKKQLVFQEFPWLQFSVLKDSFVDHHFLYHVFLIPFVSLEKVGISPLLGVEISAMFFATLLIFIFYLILKKLQIRYPLFFIFLLLISLPFVFRISLARAPAVSGIFLLAGTYFIIRRRDEARLSTGQTSLPRLYNNVLLFLISFFYVWLYSAWLLLPVILFFYIIGSVISTQKVRISSRHHSPWFASIKQVIHDDRSKIISCLSGMTLGLIINPYFPANLKFYYHHIFQIAVVNFHAKFGVGSEWYPYDFPDLFKNLFLFFVVLILTISLFFAFSKKQDRKSWVLFLLTFFFFVYTIKARRSVEYLVPFGVLFIASVYDNIFQKMSWFEMENKLKNFFSQKQRAILITLVCLLVFISPYFIYQDLKSTHKHLQHFKFTHLEKVSQRLRENAPVGETIFNANWDEFGFLFYNNSNNYYINGLDQTFMYAYNPELLELYVEIAQGQNAIHLKDNLLNKFNSRYVVLAKERNQRFYENLTHLKKDFELVYEDEEASVFKVKYTD